MIDQKPASVLVSDIFLKSAALAAAGAYMFRIGQNYVVCFPEANNLDVFPVYLVAFTFWFLAGRIIVDGWIAPLLNVSPLPGWGKFLFRLFIVSSMAMAMASILMVASAGDGFLGAGDTCYSRMKVGPFPISD